MDAYKELLANVASSAASEAAFADWIAARLLKASPQSVTP